MKDREKQTNEMAREIEKAKQHIWASVRTQAEDEDYLWHSRAIAEHLMLQGYRKLPKDSVVLSKEEYEILKIKEKEKHWLQTCMSVWENGKIDGSKETAEKFLNMIYWKAVKHIKGKNKDECFIEISFEKLDELAKEQFSVEIKEN